MARRRAKGNRGYNGRYRKKNPIAVRAMNPISKGEETLLAVLAVAAAAGGIYWWMNRYSFTLANGTMSVQVPVGTSFTLKLPSGGTWTGLASAGGAAVSLIAPTGSTPATLTSAAGMVVNATWMLNGTLQNTTITVTQ